MNVLIIEDSQTIGSIVYNILHSYGYNPHLVRSTERISAQLKTYHPNLIILDTFLEHTDPLTLCEEIRSVSQNSFILALHSKGPWQSKVDILKKGADDCVSFPFPGQELLARINALLRRPRRTHLPIITVGHITVIPDERRALYHDSPLELSRTEYQLLEYLTQNSNRSITRAELLDHVWDYTRIINSNTVDVHIQKLRKKLRLRGTKKIAGETSDTPYVGDNFTRLLAPQEQPDPIKTIHGIGYRLEGNLNPPAETGH
jgi:DNA-binding response OmpR family regulator